MLAVLLPWCKLSIHVAVTVKCPGVSTCYPYLGSRKYLWQLLPNDLLVFLGRLFIKVSFLLFLQRFIFKNIPQAMMMTGFLTPYVLKTSILQAVNFKKLSD